LVLKQADIWHARSTTGNLKSIMAGNGKDDVRIIILKGAVFEITYGVDVKERQFIVHHGVCVVPAALGRATRSGA